MKLAASILLFWFSLLTVQPAVAEVCMAMQEESCCMQSCSQQECEEESNAPCEDEDAGKCCMDGICNPCLMCYCCYGATVEKDQIKFISIAEKNNLFLNQNRNTLKGFITSPFQPPEIS